MIWPFSKFRKLEAEIHQQKETIKNLQEFQENLLSKSSEVQKVVKSQEQIIQNHHIDNMKLRGYLLQASQTLEMKEKDYAKTIAFMELWQTTNNKNS